MQRWGLGTAVAIIVLILLGSSHFIVEHVEPQPPSAEQPTPQTLDEFRAAVTKVLTDDHVPGAGIALVHNDGIEWAGGIGVADLARHTPVTAETHFRAGSISKTFVAMALVQMAEDGLLSLDDLVSDIAPDTAIDNPWDGTHPLRVIHLLQHTSGFDDMHFGEMYNVSDPPDLSLALVLRRTPGSRRVRWQPGTRMSYSNPGYAVAGFLVEQIARQPFEDYIRTHIFEPLGMTTTSFRLRPEDETTMAQGYSGRRLEPAGFPQIYLRPSGNLHTSARELGAFVQMLLNWGALGERFVVDPEYLGNMERPRTSVASAAGLRNGYGAGIMSWVDLPYPMFGHGGAIDGFVSAYGYSPARDVGFVVLLNRGDARRTLDTIVKLATGYLKRDLEPPIEPEISVGAEALREHEGYYHQMNPRNQIMAFVEWLTSGLTVSAIDGRLQVTPILGSGRTWVPVSESLFRLESQSSASRVFATTGTGAHVMIAATGGGEIYAERMPRWRVEIVRWPVLVSVALVLTPLGIVIAWLVHARWARPAGFWALKTLLIVTPLVLLLPYAGLLATPFGRWGTRNAATICMYLGTLALPTVAVAGLWLAHSARQQRASHWLVAYAALVAIAALIVSAYLGSCGVIGIRLWLY